MNDVALIRAMIAEGLTDEEIEDRIMEAKIADREARDAYGDDWEDERSTHEKEMCDRLDMGRNDAGEWLGFM